MADKKKELKGKDLDKVSGGVPLLRGKIEIKDIRIMDDKKTALKKLEDNKSVVKKSGKKPQGVV